MRKESNKLTNLKDDKWLETIKLIFIWNDEIEKNENWFESSNLSQDERQILFEGKNSLENLEKMYYEEKVIDLSKKIEYSKEFAYKVKTKQKEQMNKNTEDILYDDLEL